jgi:transposase-like protein
MIELIAERVTAALREELAAMTAELMRARAGDRPLTVGEVAERFGVARSTVYAHWREWGGYKLGEGQKATIRFQAAFLPEHPSNGKPSPEAPKRRAHQRGRAVLRGEPRLPTDLEITG